MHSLRHGASNEQTSGCEEAQHLSCPFRQLRQPTQQRIRQNPCCFHCIKQVSNQCCSFQWGCGRSANLAFQPHQEPLALIDAEHRVEARRRQTIGARVHVIGDQHLGTQSIRFTQCPELPKKPNTLIELQRFRHDTIKGGLVEFG